MKLSIAGASVYGLGNISDDSMLQSFLSGMRDTSPGLDATLICRHPGKEVEKMFDVKSIHNLDFAAKAESSGKRWRGFNPDDSTNHLLALRENIAACGALMIGGDPFDDSNTNMSKEPFRGILPYVVNVVTLAKYFQKKVVLFGIHLGRPPTSEYGVALTKFCIDNVDLITTREDDTKDTLVGMYGCPPDRIVSSADSGFALLKYRKPERTAKLDGVFLSKNIKPKKYIALTVRSYYWLWSEKECAQYAAKFAVYADRLASVYGCKVVLVPHCSYELDNYWESDINFQREIYSRCNQKENVIPIGSYLSSEELLYVIEQSEFVVSNRRHSGIYAALLGVPFYLFGERSHVGKVYGSLELTPNNFVDEKSFENMFADAGMKHLSEAFDGWDTARVRKMALAQEEKCKYATDAIAALLNS